MSVRKKSVISRLVAYSDLYFHFFWINSLLKTKNDIWGIFHYNLEYCVGKESIFNSKDFKDFAVDTFFIHPSYAISANGVIGPKFWSDNTISDEYSIFYSFKGPTVLMKGNRLLSNEFRLWVEKQEKRIIPLSYFLGLYGLDFKNYVVMKSFKFNHYFFFSKSIILFSFVPIILFLFLSKIFWFFNLKLFCIQLLLIKSFFFSIFKTTLYNSKLI